MDKTKYTAPTIKVVEFKTERGFANSFNRQEAELSQFQFEMDFNVQEGPRNEAYIFDDGTSFWD